MADVSIEDAAKEEWDLVALPGGMPGTLSKYLLAPMLRLLICKLQTHRMLDFSKICL